MLFLTSNKSSPYSRFVDDITMAGRTITLDALLKQTLTQELGELHLTKLSTEM